MIRFIVFLFIGYIIFYIHLVFNHGMDLKFSFYNIERTHNALNGMIDEVIAEDRVTRVKWMQKRGYRNQEINQTMQLVEKQYKIERKKIIKYCKFDSLDFFDYYHGFEKQFKYCTIEHGWTRPGLQNYVFFTIWYIFDKESYYFFNQISLEDNFTDKSYKIIYGLDYQHIYPPYKTSFYGADYFYSDRIKIDYENKNNTWSFK